VAYLKIAIRVFYFLFGEYDDNDSDKRGKHNFVPGKRIWDARSNEIEIENNYAAKSAAAAVIIVPAITVVMVTTAVIMLAAIAIGAGTAGGDFILRAPNYKPGSSIVINIVDYGLGK
jgi:hypothetical protein